METAPECAPRLPDCFPTPSARLPPLSLNPLQVLVLLIDYLLFGRLVVAGGDASGLAEAAEPLEVAEFGPGEFEFGGGVCRSAGPDSEP